MPECIRAGARHHRPRGVVFGDLTPLIACCGRRVWGILLEGGFDGRIPQGIKFVFVESAQQGSFLFATQTTIYDFRHPDPLATTWPWFHELQRPPCILTQTDQNCARQDKCIRPPGAGGPTFADATRRQTAPKMTSSAHVCNLYPHRGVRFIANFVSKKSTIVWRHGDGAG